MKKEEKEILVTHFILFIALLCYLIIGHIFNIYLFCPLNKLTGLYCPICGFTRLLFSLIKLDFYQAFRYNPLIFILLPIIILYYIDSLISRIKKRKSLMERTPKVLIYILVVIIILFGVLRNIDMFSFLRPTVV